MLTPGMNAPNIELQPIDGQKTSLSEFQNGRPVVVAFYKVGCPTCQFTAPYLDRMGHTASLPIVTISQDDPRATEAFNRKLGVTLPTMVDSGDANYPASNAFQITNVPSLFLVEPDGLITWAVMGFHKQAMLDLGERIGVNPFQPGEIVPEWKGG